MEAREEQCLGRRKPLEEPIQSSLDNMFTYGGVFDGKRTPSKAPGAHGKATPVYSAMGGKYFQCNDGGKGKQILGINNQGDRRDSDNTYGQTVVLAVIGKFVVDKIKVNVRVSELGILKDVPQRIIEVVS